jgi:hypothetical protein
VGDTGVVIAGPVTESWALGQHTNTATVDGSYTDDGGHTFTDSQNDDANYYGADPSYTISKSCTNEPVPQEGSANYDVTFTNTGNVPLDFTADDGIGTFRLTVGESKTFLVSLPGPFNGLSTADNTVNATGTYTDDAGKPFSSPQTANDSCWVAGEVEIIKLTQGDPNEFPYSESEWRFTLQDCGDNGCTGDTDVDPIIGDITSPPSQVNFGVDLVPVDLDPNQTYRLCEVLIPAAWTNTWQGDINDDGTPETFIPFVPAVNDDPVVDPPGWSRIFDPLYMPPPDQWTNDERCVNFVVDAGATEVFRINNEFPGGEPRTIGYWKNWNSCTGGGQVLTAIENGGETPQERLANGYALLDDVLQSPGITIGILTLVANDNVFDCDDGTQDAVYLLDKRDLKKKKRAADAAYGLASQLLAAIANDSAGAGVCEDAGQAVIDGQILLEGIEFDGSTGFYDKKVDVINGFTKQEANTLAGILDSYNNGTLCAP